MRHTAQQCTGITAQTQRDSVTDYLAMICVSLPYFYLVSTSILSSTSSSEASLSPVYKTVDSASAYSIAAMPVITSMQSMPASNL